MTTTFDLLHPKIQKAIWNLGWSEFRPIQDDAVSSLLTNKSDMLICAPTASGKTEAAFLPVISDIIDKNPEKLVKVLYISPLKALINDQFKRVEQLCEKIDFPITKWHGDANSSAKAKLLKKPGGILLITPESLEALFLNRFDKLVMMFRELDYIIIDEIHYFIENPRGTHLRSLLARLENNIKKHPTKIGLSATVYNPESISEWLNPQEPSSVKIICDNDISKGISGLIKMCNGEEIENELFNAVKKDKNLIFANNKMSLEFYCDSMKVIAKKNAYPDIYKIHHGSLSKNIREETEALLKKEKNLSVFCTNTLELGIDIGNIKRVVFLSPPFSVSSFIQRLGRSGRKEDAVKEFRFLLPYDSENDTLYEKLKFELIQSIAIVELMLEGWCEPLDANIYDYSTFVHQILSYLGQTGGDTALNIYENIGIKSFNSKFSSGDFIEILKNLKDEQIIYQTESNSITLDRLGEKIVENYKFYASFDTPVEWRIFNNGKELGKIHEINLLSLKPGKNFIFAAKRWEITEVNEDTRTIQVKRSFDKGKISFDGDAQLIHPKIHEKMKFIYESNFIPSYLAKNSIHILKNIFYEYSTNIQAKDSLVLPVFGGSRIQNTLCVLFDYMEMNVEKLPIGFKASEGKIFLINALKSIDFSTLSIQDLLSKYERTKKMKNKFDYLLPDNILNKSYADSNLDFFGTIEFIKGL